MAGYNGQELLQSDERNNWMESSASFLLLPGWNSSGAIIPTLPQHRLELPTCEELDQRCNQAQEAQNMKASLLQELQASRKREMKLRQELDESQKSASALLINLNEFQKRESVLRNSLNESQKRESALHNNLNESQKRESALRNSLNESQNKALAHHNTLNVINSRLHYEVEQRKVKEAQLEAHIEDSKQRKERFQAMLKAVIDDCKRSYSSAVADYKESQEKCKIKERADEAAWKELYADIDKQGAEIANIQVKLAEKDRSIAEKDRKIKEMQKAYTKELHSVLNVSITTLVNVSEQVNDLTLDLQNFQSTNKHVEKTNSRRTRPSPAVANTKTYLSCAEDALKDIADAKSELGEAHKAWKKAEAGLEMMKDINRKCLLAKILGKNEPTFDPEEGSLAPTPNDVQK